MQCRGRDNLGDHQGWEVKLCQLNASRVEPGRPHPCCAAVVQKFHEQSRVRAVLRCAAVVFRRCSGCVSWSQI